MLTASLPIGAGMSQQMLDRQIKPGRGKFPGKKKTEDELVRKYRQLVTDPYTNMLEEQDSLLLSKQQILAIQAADTVYQNEIDSVLVPLAKYLANLPDAYNERVALEHQEAALDAAWEVVRLNLHRWVPGILTPIQIKLLPNVENLLKQATPLKVRTFFF
jgi:hypothetical protein